ncbi:CU044_5270 family protein [Labedaea rhizosphaerae]|uniref:Uncharacterized protein n=1 Tax=Labedaea rhizosphaerae TaxID=598644 RepID=A0A4R6SP65_LABRH|nr:CU044_5270 family protein [Labedaea rhizosphaerae]TDQ05013.1 hypothetical protein EV186_101977 [Labedaea rhizosphaerae]
MDEMTLIRDLADDAPLPDAAQLADVRAKLMTEIEPRRRRRFRLVGVTSVGVAAAAAVALVVGLSGTPRGPDAAPTPPPTVQAPKVLTAAAVLDYAAEAALAEPVVAPRPDQYIYLRLQAANGYWETWTAADGKRPGYMIQTIPNAMGKTGPTPACGTKPADGPCVFASRYVAANPKSVAETMRFVIHREWPGGPVNEANFIKPASRLVAGNLLSPQLKAAVFRALKTTSVGGRPVTVRPHERDFAGREGIGLIWGSGPGHVELIFDAKTFQYLGGPGGAFTALKVVDHLKER